MRRRLWLCLVCLSLAAPGFAQSDDAELVNVAELIPGIVLDLRYATTNNFVDQKLYTTDQCLVAHGAVRALQRVQDTLAAYGLGLKIFDGYRPRSVQYLLWEILPNPTFVADPASGSIHNRGAAVDVSLVDLATGQELWMPTDFDFFPANPGDPQPQRHGETEGLAAEQIANRERLLDVMTRVGGFVLYEAEWWHYTYGPLAGNPLLDFQPK